jgi:hypothetical protein
MTNKTLHLYLMGILFVLCLVSAAPLLALQNPGELLRNGTFEGGGGPDGKGGGVPEWEPFGVGYDIDRQAHHGGDQSIRCDSLNLNKERGAQIKVELKQQRAVPILVTGWSKADQAQGAKSEDYALYIDAEYMDGTPLWGQIAAFRAGTHDWQRRQVLLIPTKPLKSMTVIALFRSHTGTAWFDDFSAHSLEGSRNFDGQAITVPAFVETAGPRLHVAGKDGLALDIDSRGGIADVKLNGQTVSGATGGFYLRDVAQDGPLVPVRGISQTRKAGGVNVGANVPGIRVSFNTRIQAEGDGITIDGEMTDLTRTDRALSVYLALPVNAPGWQWGQDIRHTQTIAPGQEYTNQTRVNVGATGGLSLYPYANVANAQGGVGIASQMDWPSVFRIFYNSATRQFVIGWDFALTGKTAAWPARNARFRCTLFRLPAGPPEWSFRQATQRFYNLNQRAFARRARADGLWLPFTAPDTIQNVSDFGFAYHEGDNSLKTDDALNILSFRYSEPMSYWLPMPPAMPRTYENALALIEKNAGQPRTTQTGSKKDNVLSDAQASPRDMAQAVLNSGTQDPFGHFNLEFRNEPWANGAVFVLNPNPELPATPDKPTKASVTYTLDTGARIYDDPAKNKQGQQDGEYLDSLESWADTQDFRPSNLLSCPYPIPFDLDDRLPVVPQWYSTHTFTRFISQDLHNRNKLLFANTVPVRFAVFAPLLDVMGIETNWLYADGSWHPDTDETFNFRRTMSAQKPYLLLMNTDYDKFTPPLVEKYFQHSLFYGVFPSMFSANAADHPYWDTPRWYNRDRDLFKKYIPLIKRLSAAGWEALPYAHTSDASVYVERYGNRLFTLLNDGRQAREITLTIDLRALNLQNGTLRATNLVTGAQLPVKSSGSDLLVSCRLNPEEAAAIELK